MGVKTAREVFFKTPDEEPTKGFDFDNDDLDEDETIATIQSTEIEIVSDVSGDVTPDAENDLVIQTQAIVGGTAVMFNFAKGLAGRSYKVSAMITTSDDQVLEAAGIMRVGER